MVFGILKYVCHQPKTLQETDLAMDTAINPSKYESSSLAVVVLSACHGIMLFQFHP